MNPPYHYLLLCGLICLLGASPAQAQTNFRPGYVLPLSGDTLRGEVDSREGRANTERCRFRATPQAQPTVYLPAQLRGYGFTADNRNYRSLPVPPAAGTAAPQPYFLEILADGPASLCFLVDSESRDEYYIGLPNQPIALLKHGMTQVLRDNQLNTVMDTGYRNTLAAALANCPVVQKQLPRLSFQESQLIKVVNTYNTACAGGYVAPRAQGSGAGSHITFGIMAGVAQQTLNYAGYPYQNGTTFKQTHMGISIGPTVKFSSRRLGQRLSLVASLLYEPEKYELEGVGAFSNGFYGLRFRQHFDLAYLRLPLMLRYTGLHGKFFPMAEAGFTVAYAVKANTAAEELNYLGTYQPVTTATQGATGGAFRESQTAFGAGLGLGTHIAGGRAVVLLIRAEKANGISNANGITNDVLHLYGLLSFDLTK